MYRVQEEVRFCYGHRLMDYVGRCSRIHGHNARVQIELSAEQLDARGFVVDFDELEATAAKWIHATLDHRLLLRDDDPAIDLLDHTRDGVVVLPFNPTAENLARMIFNRLKSQGLPVSAVKFWETETSVATVASEDDRP